MDTVSTYVNLIDRTVASLDRIPELDAGQVNAHSGGHPNSAAWNLWHAGRVLDAMGAAALGDQPQIWENYREKFNLGDNAEGTGFGHTEEEAATITAELPLLLEYLNDSLEALRAYVTGLSNEDFDDVIGEFNGNPQTRQGRLSLILVDSLQHIAQVQFLGGMKQL